MRMIIMRKRCRVSATVEERRKLPRTAIFPMALMYPAARVWA